ncbi:universal stress protein [Aquabacterium sp. J223]|uniref:universal stress protein n=1 Tax=Aquabacterium sp. J223 TaxID=2898431 RepID=UPI0021AD9DD7|nr:universal stress protein [Aquabacterium sp. J223]UUX95033.1 universal stress protein [Aquabacterium sp. J223]
MHQRILVPVDGSQTAELGLAEAIAIAQPMKARLLLLSVVNDLDWLVEGAAIASSAEAHQEVLRYAENVVEKARQTAAARDVQAETSVRETTDRRAADTIVDEARRSKCDLIVMGTHGRRGLGRLVLGSDAMAVVQASPVPVMLVRTAPPRVA